jgi:tetratricopeptide (TPR) repeat protein
VLLFSEIKKGFSLTLREVLSVARGYGLIITNGVYYNGMLKTFAQKYAGVLTVLAAIIILAALWYVVSGGSPLGDRVPSEIKRGGAYEELAKNHDQGERFLGFINAAFDRLENDDPDDDVSAYLDIGFYKNELGDTKGAIEAYRVGLDKFPGREVMMSNLAHIYENRKEYDNAEQYYQDIIAGNPQSTRAITDLGSMYRFYFDDKDAEIVQLVEVQGLANNPNDLNLFSFLANYYRYDVQDLGKAETYYRKILEIDPQNIAVKVELNNLLQQQGLTGIPVQ